MLTMQNAEIMDPRDGSVRLEATENGIRIRILPTGVPIKQAKIKWFFDTSFMKKVLPDTWGVALADLEWLQLPLKDGCRLCRIYGSCPDRTQSAVCRASFHE